MIPSRAHQEDAADLCARRIQEVVPRAMRLLRREMRAVAGPGLSVPQFRVLAFLGRNPGPSLSAVADHVGVAKPTASVMVDRLVQRGLVTRSGNPDERRRVVLALTPAGAALLERARTRTRERVVERLGTLRRSELATLAGGLALLDRALGTETTAGGAR